MKKYLVLGLAVVLLGVMGARVWYVRSACGGRAAPAELAQWLENPDMNVFEIGDKSFYVQEAIGSQGITLAYPKPLKGDFRLKFDLMSLTSEVEIRLRFGKENGVYETEMKFSAKTSKLKFYKNKTLVLEKDAAQIQPDVFYNFLLRREGRFFSFAVDNQEVLRAETDDLPVAVRLSVTGFPDNPAAVEIMDWDLQN